MSQYKRIVSYIYQYIDGEKGQNMGYLRLEQKAKQCRIVVQMKAVPVELMPQVWLYKQRDTGIEYINIGKLSVFSGSLQCKVTTVADNIFMSGHTATDFDGAIIYINNKEYYATTWTDDGLFIGEIVNMSSGNTIENNLAKNYNENNNQNNDIQEDTLDNNDNSNTTEDNIEESGSSNYSSENVSLNNANNDNTNDDDSSENDSVDNTDDNDTEDVLAENTDKGNNSESILTDNTDNGNNLESISSDNMGNSNDLESISTNINNYEGGNEKEANNKNIKDSDVSGSDIEAAVQNKEDSVSEIETQSICNSCPFNRQGKLNKNFGQRILKEFPVMYPFESGCISRSVKIEPKDLGCMPIKLWAFANNRFLLHGYYCYKHLIFAGLRDGGYAIGVPGVYSESERRSAAGYSFTGFQPIGSGKVDQGVFGYWLHVI